MDPPDRIQDTTPTREGVDPTDSVTPAPRLKPRSVFEMIRAHADHQTLAWCTHRRCETQAIFITDVVSIASLESRNARGMAGHLRSHLAIFGPKRSVREPAVLIVQGIDEAWNDMLYAEFPESLGRRFLARHILRCGDLGEKCKEGSDVSHVSLVEAIEAELASAPSPTWKKKEHYVSLHMNLVRRSEIYESDPLNADICERPAFRYLKYRSPILSYCKHSLCGRVSCCQLTDSLCKYRPLKHMIWALLTGVVDLVLVDRPPLQDDDSSLCSEDEALHSISLRNNSTTLEYASPLSQNIGKDPTSVRESLKPVFTQLFKTFSVRSVFKQQRLLSPPPGTAKRTYAPAIAILIVIVSRQKILTTLEADWVTLRYNITREKNESAFKSLVGFRRYLADRFSTYTETKLMVETLLLQVLRLYRPTGWNPSVDDSSGTMTDTVLPDAKQGSMPTRRQSANMERLSATFAELHPRFLMMISSVNDEIRLVIGAVQIDDAQKTREQTELTTHPTELSVRLTESTVQQAKWTIVLAFLAAFYLPMTLVTGIFGMNIKEISEDKGPSKGWVIGIWALAFVLTGAYVGTYAWQEYKERKEKEGLQVTILRVLRSWWWTVVVWWEISVYEIKGTVTASLRQWWERLVVTW